MKFRSYTKVAAMAALLVVSTACSWVGDDDARSTRPISMSPASGPVGTLLTFTSTDFDLATITGVTVNGTPALIVSKEAGTARALVMPGSTTGSVVVSVVVTNSTGKRNATFAMTTFAPIATQQGNKLVGTGNTGAAKQGWSVALSADGKTALVGGSDDNNDEGAAWVFIRSGTAWTQQEKLVGTGNTGAAKQGVSVALSADGNTALAGGYNDNSGQGAAWVFTRSGTTWSQQGTKLVGTGNTGAAQQGYSVALSADGNTALVAGPLDNSNQGAVWVFTRSGTTWSQQGTKLVGTGGIAVVYQGASVALSADGNTALVGGWADNSGKGAAWVFTRSGATWTQQEKLVFTGAIENAFKGASVALSADGNTALVGGWGDNFAQGAAWVFTRSGTTWTQQGTKLVGTGNLAAAHQGWSVALSADGNTALVGGYQDDYGQGAVWVFTRSGTTWSQRGEKLVGTGNVGTANQGFSVDLSADGSTALVGGIYDDTFVGAAWVWVP